MESFNPFIMELGEYCLEHTVWVQSGFPGEELREWEHVMCMCDKAPSNPIS